MLVEYVYVSTLDQNHDFQPDVLINLLLAQPACLEVVELIVRVLASILAGVAPAVRSSACP